MATTDKGDRIELQNQIMRDVTNGIGFSEFPAIGRDAFEAYRRQQGGLAFDGTPIPAWDHVPERIRVAWVAAVMRATKEFVAHVSGDLGCFLRAYELGEPTFTLRGRDPSAPECVMLWIAKNPQVSDSKRAEAFQKAERMRTWKEHRLAD